MPIQNVSEFPATAEEQIHHFAELLSRSELRRKVFAEIYRGKSKTPKTAEAIKKKVHVSAKRVLEIATPLANNHLFEKTKTGGHVAYLKYPNINTVKAKILRLATNRKKREAHVTMRNPKAQRLEIVLAVKPKTRSVHVSVDPITIDDMDNFSKVRSLNPNKLPKLKPDRLPETVFKTAVAKILGNKGDFKDWGGEKNDLYTSHLKIDGARYAAAFGFKGPAKKPPLTPGKMGKNGDQIQRLFETDAQVFIVQFEGRIEQSVLEQMRALAVNKSLQNQKHVYYGVIAHEDSHRLRVKYPQQFAYAAK